MSETTDIQKGTDHAFPSLEVLQRYLQGKATESEKARIEALMEDDPMMADAMEGLTLVKDTAALQATMLRLDLLTQKRLRRQIPLRERNSKRKSRVAAKHYLPYLGAAAAALALIFMTVFIVQELNTSQTMANAEAVESMTQQPPEELAMQTQPSETAPEMKATPPVPAETSQIKPETEAPVLVTQRVQAAPQRAPAYSASGQPIAAPPTPSPTAQAPTAMESADQTTPALSSPKPMTTPASSLPPQDVAGQAKKEQEVADTENERDLFMDDEVVAAIPEYTEEEEPTREQASRPAATNASRAKERAENTNVDQYAPIMSEEQTQKAALQKAKAIADLIQEAVVHLEKEEWSAAESKLNEVLIPQPQNVVALHYMAQTQLQKGDDPRAVDYLKRLVNLDAQNYPEDQWQLAQAYLRLNKKLAARSVLKEIVTQGGPYAEQAQELLNR